MFYDSTMYSHTECLSLGFTSESDKPLSHTQKDSGDRIQHSREFAEAVTTDLADEE